MAFRYYNVGEGSAGAFIFFVLIVLFSLLIMKLTGKEE
jgi:multiple sugar transport system permease protein